MFVNVLWKRPFIHQPSAGHFSELIFSGSENTLKENLQISKFLIFLHIFEDIRLKMDTGLLLYVLNPKIMSKYCETLKFPFWNTSVGAGLLSSLSNSIYIYVWVKWAQFKNCLKRCCFGNEHLLQQILWIMIYFVICLSKSIKAFGSHLLAH